MSDEGATFEDSSCGNFRYLLYHLELLKGGLKNQHEYLMDPGTICKGDLVSEPILDCCSGLLTKFFTLGLPAETQPAGCNPFARLQFAE